MTLSNGKYASFVSSPVMLQPSRHNIYVKVHRRSASLTSDVSDRGLVALQTKQCSSAILDFMQQIEIKMKQYRVLLLSFCLILTDPVYCITLDVCTGYKFSATCGTEELIVMESAELGRMEPSECIPVESGNFGCTNDVLFLTDRWCSGRKQCEFTSPNSEIMDANTDCRRDLVVYLRAKYKCVKVLRQPCSSVSSNRLAFDHGLISNHVTDETGCGSLKSPWVIEANAGQTIEISLLDFKALDRAKSHTLVTCSDVYGFIVERTLNINQTICGLHKRESVIYKSKTNVVEIHIRAKTGNRFMLFYRANGCSDPNPPPNAWYKRNGNEAVIGCEQGDKQWRVTCKGNVWTGKTGNCTKSAVNVNAEVSDDNHTFELSTVVIVAGIIGGTIVLAVAVIVCGVVYIQKFKDRQEKKYAAEQKAGDKCYSELTHAPYCPGSSEVTDCQEEYLQPNTMPRDQHRAEEKGSETLIHIWETPLPDPKSSQQPQGDQNRCTIHRKPVGQDIGSVAKDGKPIGTSYYSPQTGHKYYVLDR